MEPCTLIAGAVKAAATIVAGVVAVNTAGSFASGVSHKDGYATGCGSGNPIGWPTDAALRGNSSSGESDNGLRFGLPGNRL